MGIFKRNGKMELDLKCVIVWLYFEFLWLVYVEFSLVNGVGVLWRYGRCFFWVGVCMFFCFGLIFVNNFGKNENIEF